MDCSEVRQGAQFSAQQMMDNGEFCYGVPVWTAASGSIPPPQEIPALTPSGETSEDGTEPQEEIYPCEECGTDATTKCWHQMSYEEWLVDVRRVEALRQQSAAAAAASAAASSRPPPQKGSVEIVLSHRGRRRRQQWPRPAPQNAVTKPLRVQMLKVHLRQKMMPAIMEVPAQQMEWSDDDDDINVIL